MTIRILSSLLDISRDAWAPIEDPNFPFFDYAFLEALELSESVGEESGWRPLYLVYEEQARILGALCCYIKSHSYGEYIFDWQWAQFFQRYALPYYPKLLSAVPFTPATGPRLLTRPDADPQVKEALLAAALHLAQKGKMSSYHALFIEEDERALFEAQGCSIRRSMQYHWKNQGYRDFQDFLDSLLGKRRRDILRERERLQSHGLSIELLSASDLNADLASVMNELYLGTAEKKDAIPYLHADFFPRLYAGMPEQVLMIVAKRKERIVAATLNLQKGAKLYGRYWGSFETIPGLHFELCYYQQIAYAIKKGLAVFEAGAQGEHKVQRGFLPSATWSAHKIFDTRFAEPISRYIVDEAAAVQRVMEEWTSPFKAPERA